MTPEQKMVLEFHETFGIYAQNKPGLVPDKVRDLRIRLIDEEFDEFKQACLTNNFLEVVDAIGDLLYVVYGAACAFGVDMEPIFKEIHRSNMSKQGGALDMHGKWIKPSTYSPPDLAFLLEQQRRW